MKFVLAIIVFLIFVALFVSGIVLLLAGKPWLFALAVVLFLGTFIKYGCLSH